MEYWIISVFKVNLHLLELLENIEKEFKNDLADLRYRRINNQESISDSSHMEAEGAIKIVRTRQVIDVLNAMHDVALKAKKQRLGPISPAKSISNKFH